MDGSPSAPLASLFFYSALTVALCAGSDCALEKQKISTSVFDKIPRRLREVVAASLALQSAKAGVWPSLLAVWFSARVATGAGVVMIPMSSNQLSDCHRQSKPGRYREGDAFASFGRWTRSAERHEIFDDDTLSARYVALKNGEDHVLHGGGV